MRYEAFKQQLLTTGAHKSSPRGRSLCGRLFGWSDIWFYSGLFGVVLRAWAVAVSRRYDERAWARSSYQTLRLAENTGVPVSVSGLEHLAAVTGPVVIVGNHMSLMETFLVACLVKPFTSLCTVVKESLLRYPFFGRVLRSTRPIAVSRKNPREDLRTVLEQGREALAQGRSVVLFPQATRRNAFHREQFNSLGAKLASRAGVPLVPVAIRTDFLGIGKWVRDFGRIDRRRPIGLAFGPAVPAGTPQRDAHEQTVRFIATTLAEWGVPVDPGATPSD
jgi:1-acyl-sn-glycerol-3-phosphate acyltransferase